MAISTYSELQAAVASGMHRSDLTTEILDFIRLAEADLQVRARLSQWDTSATVTVTSGSGSLPADFVQAKSAVWGSQTGTLPYLEPAQFANYLAGSASGEPVVYTVESSSLKVAPSSSGTVALIYKARFTPLSVSATSNSLLSLFPDAYLYGSLAHGAIWARDEQSASTNLALFEAAINRVKTYITEFKFPKDLIVRVA